MNGTIKSLVVPTGKKEATYGFIKGDDGFDRFFLPEAVIIGSDLPWRDLKVGHTVAFESLTHPKGERAINVRALMCAQAS